MERKNNKVQEKLNDTFLFDSSSTSISNRNSQSSQSQFIPKLVEILDDRSNSEFIYWNRNGTSVIFKDTEAFSQIILPKYGFKTTTFDSFTRQLNMYNFHKVKNVNSKGTRSKYVEFKNENFIRDKPHLRANIKRKTKEKNDVNLEERITNLEEKLEKNDVNLEERITNIEEKLANITNLEDKLANITNLEEKLANIFTNLEQKLANITNLEQKLNDVEYDNQNLKHENQNLKQILKQKIERDNQVAILERKLDDFEYEYQKLEQQLDDVKLDNQNLKSKLNEVENLKSKLNEVENLMIYKEYIINNITPNNLLNVQNNLLNIPISNFQNNLLNFQNNLLNVQNQNVQNNLLNVQNQNVQNNLLNVQNQNVQNCSGLSNDALVSQAYFDNNVLISPAYSDIGENDSSNPTDQNVQNCSGLSNDASVSPTYSDTDENVFCNTGMEIFLNPNDLSEGLLEKKELNYETLYEF